MWDSLAKFVSGKLKYSKNIEFNIFNLIIFSWVYPIFYKGYKKPLEYEDLYKPSTNDEAHKISDQLEK